MATSVINTDYLQFSANSIKDLITRKLSLDSTFTDQIYEGSNLSILIDIISYMYQCLIYNLNNTAAESMFADTLIYENINRLVKFIGYSPKGFRPGSMLFIFNNTKDSVNEVPLYSYIDTGLSDKNGAKIYYSSTEAFRNVLSQSSVNIALTCGKWYRYQTTFTATGEEYETFVLDGLSANSNKPTTVAWPFVHIYVEHAGLTTRWQTIYDSFLINSTNTETTLYGNDSQNVELQLNENKQYVIKFGNGINSKKLSAGDIIHIVYLKTNTGLADEIKPGQVNGILHTDAISNLLPTLPKSGVTKNINNVRNITKSSGGIAEESVDDIKANAPAHYIIANRLITHADYEKYVKMLNAGNVIDVLAQNNYEYISTFYKWLYSLGVTNHGNPTYYLNESRITKYNYQFSDAADGNNIYLWIKMKNLGAIFAEAIDEQIRSLKLITTEVSYLEPIILNYAICAAPRNIIKDSMQSGISPDDNSYIEIILDSSSTYSSANVKTQIYNIILDFFKDENFNFGKPIRLDELQEQIFMLNGVLQIHTVYNDGKIKTVKNGISFAKYSNSIIDCGDDLELVSGTHTNEIFLAPQLINADKLESKIVITTTLTNNINNNIEINGI